MKIQINIIITLIFLIQVYFSFSQTWPKYYGEPNRHDYSRDIIETYDNGYLICGGYFNDDFSGAWLIKTNINGDTLWEKILDCDGFNYLNAIHQTIDGGILACGAIKYQSYSAMPYVIKFDACGQKLWCKSFYTQEELPWAQDINETPSGDIIILVNQFGESPEETMHLFKLNSEGDIIWKKPYCSGYMHPEGAIPLGSKVIITSQNDYLISGDVYWEDPWNPGGTKGLRSLFVLVDSIGNEKWVLPFGIYDTIYGHAYNTFQKGENSFISVGRAFGQQVDREGIVMKLDTNGNEVDFNVVNFQEIDTSFKVGLFSDILEVDSFYILASFFDSDPNGQAPPGELIIDSNELFSNFEVNQYTHYLSNDDPYNIMLSFNKKLLSNSVFDLPYNWDIFLSKLNLNLEHDTLDPGNYTYDSLCTTPGLPQSGFIYLDDCDIVTDVPSPEEYHAFLETIPVKAYPNPTTEGVVTIEYENTEHHQNIELRCFDIYGNEVYKEKVFRYQGKSIVSIGSWGKGMYVAVVYSNGLVVGRCKFALLR